MMKTEFFTQIAPMLLRTPGLSLNLFFKDGRLTISILPTDKDGKHQLTKPFVMSATLEELNEGFFEELEKGLAEKVPAAGITSNAVEVSAELNPPAKVKVPAKKKVLPKPGKKGTKMDWVKYHLSLNEFDKAQEVVDAARKGGGLKKSKVEELQKIVTKAITLSQDPKVEKVEEPIKLNENEQLEIPVPACYSDEDLAEFKVLLEAKLEEAEKENTGIRAEEKEVDDKIAVADDINVINTLSEDLKKIRLKKLQAVKAVANYKSRLTAITQKTFGIDSTSDQLIPKDLLKSNLLLTVIPNA